MIEPSPTLWFNYSRRSAAAGYTPNQPCLDRPQLQRKRIKGKLSRSLDWFPLSPGGGPDVFVCLSFGVSILRPVILG